MDLYTLPAQVTPFIGRQDELLKIATRLDDPACRLMTMIGFGGSGKTRLALEAAGNQAACFPDGVYFVPLQPLTTPEYILSTIAEAIHFRFFSSDDPQDQIVRYLRDKICLLVLDNFEHLLEGAPLLSDLLSAAPGLKLLVTSREALNLQEEWLYPVQGMAYPDSTIGMESFSAVQLFVQSARRSRPGFSLVDEAEGVLHICQLVEGMPLGIELAASWVRVMSCAEIASEMQSSLDILESSARNVPSRHRTMRTVLEQSWGMLTEKQRTTFQSLSVFRGGFTRDAAKAVTDTSLHILSALVSKSWLRWHASRKRYDIHELLRQFGEENLRRSDADWKAANDRHCNYFTSFLEARGHELAGDKDAEALLIIDADLENVRTFWEWAVTHGYDRAIEITLDGLWFFYDTGSRYQEGERLFASAIHELRTRDSDAESRLLGKLLARQGALYRSLNRFELAHALFQESETLLQAFPAPYDLAFSLHHKGLLLMWDNQFDAAESAFFTSLALCQQANDLRGAGYAHIGLNAIFRMAGKLEQAREQVQASFDIFTSLGNQHGTAVVYLHLAYLSEATGLYREERLYAQSCLAGFQKLDVVWGIAGAYRQLGWAALRLEEYAAAFQAAQQALTIEVKYHMTRYLLQTLWLVVCILDKQKQFTRALELLGTIEVFMRKSGGLLGPLGGGISPMLLKLQANMTPEDYSDALERGRALELEASGSAMPLELEDYIQAEVARTAAQPLGSTLTNREMEVLRFLAVGLSNREIALKLILSLGTVKWYVSDIYSKLGVGNRTQAVARGRELNLLI